MLPNKPNMDYKSLMKMASAKQESKDKIKISRYSSELPPPKKESKEAVRSDVIKRLIQEKENEKQRKETAKKEEEKKRLEREEKRKTQFRIPKKKAPEVNTIDTEKLINSLFEDTEEDQAVLNGNDSSGLSRLGTDDKSNHPTLPVSGESNRILSSSIKQEKPSTDTQKSTHDSSKSSPSLSGEKKSHSSSSSHSHSKSSSSSHSKSSSSSHSKSSSSSSSSHPKSSSSSSHPKSSSSSSSSHPKSSSSSSSSHSKSSSSSHSKSSSSSHSKSSSSSEKKSSSEKAKSSSSSTSSSSKSHRSSSASSSSANNKSGASLSSSSSTPPKSSLEQPVTLSKHHLKPVAERQVNNTQLSEKEKILAKLQAIKERTLAAINKEQEGKGKRSRGEKSHRNSKKEVKEDDKVKSKEIVKETYSSDEEGEGNNMPSVIDIMLSEHQSKLEKDKIARMAKQAWERATKKNDGEDDSNSRKKERKKSSSKPKGPKSLSSSNHHKRKEHSVSPDPTGRPSVKKNGVERKKPKIVRHAGQGAPPPMDFKAILAMAEQKVKEPSKPVTLGSIPKKKKKEDEGRPMTQEEKERKERIKSKEYQHWLKFGGKCPNSGKEYNSSGEDSLEDTRRTDKKDNLPSAPHSRKENGHSVSVDKKSMTGTAASKSQSSRGEMNSRPGGKIPDSGVSGKSREVSMNENVLVCGPAQDEDSDDDSNRPASNPFDRIYKSVHKKKPGQTSLKRKHVEVDSEEDEGSDLDGFIDDGGDEQEDYSSHISKIFGYNKHRYVDEDDDLSDMEANFDTVMKEEKRSAKLGMMEDLEDMRREEEELRQKALLRKKMRR